MIEQIKAKIKEKIYQILKIETITVEEPKRGDADLAIPLFGIAKELNKSPMDVYQQLEGELSQISEIDHTVFIAGFLNMYLNRNTVGDRILRDIEEKGNTFGSEIKEEKEVVVIDYSSPNIAKSFSVGHLRSTVIGNALKHIYQKIGYEVIGINYLGDWGTQFGKMIVAYQKWGKKEEIEKNPIAELQKLYVKFHEEEKNDESLELEGRKAFLMLEKQDPEYIKLWQWFRDESLKEFMNMYELLGVSFDSYQGEAFYNDKMDHVVDLLDQKGLLKLDQDELIVDIGSDLPPARVKRSDGATLYMTRDLAAVLYRYETYHFSRILYVVGNEQRLHFTQLKRVTDLMGYQFDLHHVNFGLVLVDGKKMSTRGGKFKKLSDVIEQAVLDAKTAILEKNPNLKDQDEVAKAVGIGAIIFNDLKNERHLDIDFSLENMLKFEGQTGPYIQYSSVRIASILKGRTIDLNHIDASVFNEPHYFDIIKLLSQFPSILKRAAKENMPSVLSKYLISLAQAFNHFYGKEKVIVEDLGRLNANLLFVKSVRNVLNQGLEILGIQTLDEM